MKSLYEVLPVGSLWIQQRINRLIKRQTAGVWTHTVKWLHSAT